MSKIIIFLFALTLFFCYGCIGCVYFSKADDSPNEKYNDCILNCYLSSEGEKCGITSEEEACANQLKCITNCGKENIK